MASSYSTNLGLELPANGEQSGTWGTTTNTNLGTLVEQAISGYVTQVITDGADTTITIPNGSTGVARNMYLELTGTLTADRNLLVPANKKLYFIYNNTTGGYAVTVKVSGQTGVSVPNGKKTILVSNGTDIVDAVTYFGSFSLTAIDNTPIGSSTPHTGAFTYVKVTGSSEPTNGIYLPAANTLGFATNTTQWGTLNSTGNWVLNAPSSGVTLYVNGVSGSHSAQIEDSAGNAFNVGYLNVPVNSQSGNYTAVLSDAGKFIYHDAAAGSGDTYTIPANVSVAYPIGTVLTFVNLSSSVTIAITSDTMYLAASGSTGSRTLGSYGIATAIKVESTKWLISGSDLT